MFVSLSDFNIAVGKTAWQSSTYSVLYASLANDGDYATYCSGNDPVGGANWWAVDMIHTVVVKYVVVVSISNSNGKHDWLEFMLRIKGYPYLYPITWG